MNFKENGDSWWYTVCYRIGLLFGVLSYNDELLRDMALAYDLRSPKSLNNNIFQLLIFSNHYRSK
jgi:hypothetical protein